MIYVRTSPPLPEKSDGVESSLSLDSHFCHHFTWLGDQPEEGVKRSHLQASWPGMKAVRDELALSHERGIRWRLDDSVARTALIAPGRHRQTPRSCPRDAVGDAMHWCKLAASAWAGRVFASKNIQCVVRCQCLAGSAKGQRKQVAVVLVRPLRRIREPQRAAPASAVSHVRSGACVVWWTWHRSRMQRGWLCSLVLTCERRWTMRNVLVETDGVMAAWTEWIVTPRLWLMLVHAWRRKIVRKLKLKR